MQINTIGPAFAGEVCGAAIYTQTRISPEYTHSRISRISPCAISSSSWSRSLRCQHVLISPARWISGWSIRTAINPGNNLRRIATMMSLGTLLQRVYGSPLPSPQRRGLYYPPEGGKAYANHKEWAGSQRPSTDGFMALSLAGTNPAIHRCRIGKITLKQAS